MADLEVGHPLPDDFAGSFPSFDEDFLRANLEASKTAPELIAHMLKMRPLARDACAFGVREERLRIARYIMRKSIDANAKDNKVESLALFEVASELALSLPD